MGWNPDFAFGGPDWVNFQNLTDLLSRLEALLTERDPIAVTRADMEAQQNRTRAEIQQINAEKRALELRLNILHADLMQKENSLRELKDTTDNINQHGRRRSTIERCLRQEIDKVKNIIQRKNRERAVGATRPEVR